MNHSTSETLNRAADLIQERGLGQGPLGFAIEASSPCLLGAIAQVAGWAAKEECGIYDYDAADRCPAAIAVHDYLDHPRISAPGDLWAWNDEGGRTASTVVEVLRAVAVIEAAREEVEVSA